MNTQDIIKLAEDTLEQADMRTSAEHCISVARHHIENTGDDGAAYMWATKALRYTIGVFDPRYQAAIA